jgi:hypothetical protein
VLFHGLELAFSDAILHPFGGEVQGLPQFPWLATLMELCITPGCPDHLRSDKGPEFCARIARARLA